MQQKLYLFGVQYLVVLDWDKDGALLRKKSSLYLIIEHKDNLAAASVHASF